MYPKQTRPEDDPGGGAHGHQVVGSQVRLVRFAHYLLEGLHPSGPLFFLLAPLRLFRPPLDEENRFEAGGGAVGKRPLVVVVTGAQGLQASILVSVGFL